MLSVRTMRNIQIQFFFQIWPGKGRRLGLSHELDLLEPGTYCLFPPGTGRKLGLWEELGLCATAANEENTPFQIDDALVPLQHVQPWTRILQMCMSQCFIIIFLIQFFQKVKRVQRGSARVQRGSVGSSALACCKAGPSSNLGSAPHGGSAQWADSCEDMEMGLSDCLRMNFVWMYPSYKTKPFIKK